MKVDEQLVRELVHDQFPQWSDLPVTRVERAGWDNRSFRLGSEMVVRLPSADAYAPQVEKEHHWLPVLGRSISCPIPVPLALGAPARGYTWPWSIYRWLTGEPAGMEEVAESADFAADVAQFLRELQGTDATGGPLPGVHNFHRGGSLATYDAQVREAIRILDTRIDAGAATEIWEQALATRWLKPPIWVHGDISPGNLLTIEGRVCGVLDFGMLAVGDPACDLAISWTVFRGKAREAFRAVLDFDEATWLRARAWGLWKGLIIAAGLAQTNAVEWADPPGTIERILRE